MQPIQPTIKPGDTGPQVANLHAVLLFLLKYGKLVPPSGMTTEDMAALADGIRADQAAGKAYGGSAERTVFYFQLQFGFGSTLEGLVEERTARQLNALLPESQSPDDVYAVRCRAVDAEGRPIAGLRITLFNQDPESRHDRLGEPAITDADGMATFRFVRSDFTEHPDERGPDLFFQVTRAEDADRDAVPLHHTLPDMRNDQGVLRNFQPQEEPIVLRVDLEGGYLVQGVVTDEAGRPAAGLKVVAWDRDLLDSQFLGDAATDAGGRYRIAYRLAQAAAGEGLPVVAADLELRVLPADGTEPLAVSAVRFNAKREETIDLVVPVRESGPVEFDEVSRRVLPMLGDRHPDVLTAEHIDFIVGDTGLELDAVRAWVAGARLQREALVLLGDDGASGHQAALQDLGRPFGHAWHRMGWAGTLAGMLGSSDSLWEAALDAGAQRRWIAPFGPEQSKPLLAALAHLRLLSGADPVHSSDPMAPALAPFTGQLPREMAATAFQLYRERGEVAFKDFPALAGDDAESKAHLATLAQGIRVYGLVEGHAGLIEPLMSRLKGAQAGLDQLADIRPEDWQALAAEAVTDPAAVQGLAYRMQVRVEQQAPAAALIARMEQGLLPDGDDSPLGTVGLLKDNQAVVDTLLRGGEVAADSTFIDSHKGIADTLVDVGRYVKVGISLGAAWDLQKDGRRPGDLMTNYGKGNRPVGPQGPEGPLGTTLPPEVNQALDRLHDKFGRTLYDLTNPGFGGPRFRFDHDIVQAGLPSIEPPKLEPLKTLPGISDPTLRGMFGDLDDCVCRPCDSVLGPGAYLVELIRALQREVRFSPNGYELLIQRRPDIVDLELSCENADTLLPHIDLALEQLEWLAATQDRTWAVSATVTTGRPSTPGDWFTQSVHASIRALLQKTIAQPLDTALTAMEADRSVNRWLVRESGGARSWFLEPNAASGQPVDSWRLLGMSHRRTDANPDPRIEPAHRLPAAYAALADATALYPWNLPYSAAEQERAALVAALKVDPLRLGPIDPTYDQAPADMLSPLSRLDRDTLGLTAAEEAILAAARTGDGVWNAWGFADDNPVTILGSASGNPRPISDPASGEELNNDAGRPSRFLPRASFLMARSGLTLEEIEAALATGFVGGYRLSKREQYKTSLMLAQKDPAATAPQNIDGAALDRLHRLVRLWRRLPAWSLPTLDSAIESMQGSPAAAPWQLRTEQLRLLAAMERARRALGVSAELLLSLRLPLETVRVAEGDASTTLWRRVYLAATLPAKARAAFENPAAANPGAWQHWFAPAAAAVQLPAAEVASLGEILGSNLRQDSLTWLHRHAVLARALGRPVTETLLLLQWMGWGREGLGRGGDPLGGVGTAAPTLKQRTDDFNRLAQLPEISSTFARTGIPLVTLAAAQVPALQRRTSTTSPPMLPGARNGAALRGMLLALRLKLAAVPEPNVSNKLSWLQATMAEAWTAMGWAAELYGELEKHLASPPADGLDGLSGELKEQLAVNNTPLADPKPLLSLQELALLLKPSAPEPEARFRFLLDRIVERRGEREREVLARLMPQFPDAQALLRQLNDSDEKVRATAVERFASDAQRQFGQVLPLFTMKEAARFVKLQPLNSWRSRLDDIDTHLAVRERERLLLDEVRNWAAASGAEWTDATAAGFLSDRLTIEPTNPNSTTRRLARDRFLSTTLYRSTSAEPPAELTAWIERLDTLLVLRAREAAVAALTDLPGLDWGPLISQAKPAERQSLAGLLWLADPTHLGLPTLRTVLDPAINLVAMREALAQRLGISPTLIAELADAARPPDAAALTARRLREPATLRRLFDLAQTARRLKASGSQLAALVSADTDAAITSARALLAAMLGPREWPKELRRLNDQSRRSRRDALVTYLVHRTPGIRDADALFERMLLDPQIEPCLDTTRLRQATASLQMLIQRILEGLEPGATATDKLRTQWSWLRSYRLWEANRKVFLYPENWLMPELRDDKSPEFRALESELAEEELTATRANQAFGRFIDGINATAQTRIVAAFEDLKDPTDRNQRRDLYIVGRSPNPPYRHYWRIGRDFGKRWMEWTPWERIELDIQSDHVVPFVAAGQFHVTWPLIQGDLVGKPAEEAKNNKWSVELATSRFDGARWTQISRSRGEDLVVDRVPFEDARSAFAFRSFVPPSGLNPTIYGYVKGVAAGTATTKEPSYESAPEDLRPPAHFYSESGIAELAQLVAKVFDKLPEDDRDYIEIFLHCTLPNPTADYWLGLDKIFLDTSILNSHRQHWRGKGFNINTTPIVDQQKKEASSLIRFLKEYRRQFYGSDTSSTAAHWTTNRYVDFIYKVLRHCSALKIDYRVQVDLGNSNLLSVAVASADAKLTFADRSVYVRSPHYGYLIQPAPTPATTCTLQILRTPSGLQVPSSEPENVPEVDAGKLQTLSLNFLIKDPRSLGGFTPPPEARDFRQCFRFRTSVHGEIEATRGDSRKTLEALGPELSVWVGGFREPESSKGSVLALPRTGDQPLGIFQASNSLSRFEIGPASTIDQINLRQAAVWFYSEGSTGCVIDTQASPPTAPDAAKVAIYPTAWLSGQRLLLNWQVSGRLPNWQSQSDDFGAGALPARAPQSRSALPDEILLGRWTFDNRLPNASYWWEICLHGPLLIADQFSRQQRFQEADQWLRMVFDPLAADPGDLQAFLRFRRFRELPRGLNVAADLKALAQWAAGNTGSAPPSVALVQATIERWRSQPFRPFVIARRRHVAFLWRTLFAYLDNLLAWADSLYRRENRADIREAVLHYIQVARLLGPRPRLTRRASARPAASFLDYKAQWDEFANAWLGAIGPIDSARETGVRVLAGDDQEPPVEGLLYFCIPPNDRILTYWDMVEDRLRNIRNCRNIDGVERILPLEAPEIDLDELIRSVSAGGTLEQFLAESFAEPWPYRYQTLLAQARDLVGEVKSLGSQLLAALEKRDAERLAQLRSRHELDLLDRVTGLRQLQIDEAQSQVDSLQTSREAIAARYEQLQHLLGKEGVRAPELHQTAGAESRLGRLSSGNAYAPSNLGLIVEEAEQLEQYHFSGFWTDADSVARLVAWGFNSGSSVAAFFSVFEQAVAGGSTKSEKVSKALGALGSAASSTADGFRAIAQIHQTQAARLGQKASNLRRRDEWAFQSNQSLRELATADKQIRAAEARLAISKRELDNHKLQREQAAATDAYLREKFTSLNLYQWQCSQVLGLYRSTYATALAMARRARQAAERELAVRPLPAIRDRWDAGRSGLLAGERLQQDLKGLELAALERHVHDEQPTRHVSLRLLEPQALVDLITTGRCTFETPEWLFDLDAPGHYLRRIRSVRVSIPCVTGPYTSINARLSLLRSDIRLDTRIGIGTGTRTGYEQKPDGDDRFETRFHASESIFITSGREDSGLIEANLRDDRYLPFEGAGVVAKWQLEFPSDTPQFDRTTISDVVLHLQYTARHGGKALADNAREALEARFQTPVGTDGPGVMISLRTDFAADWARAAAAASASVEVTLDPHAHLPYWMRATGFSLASSSGATDLQVVALHRPGAAGELRSTRLTAQLRNRTTLALAELSNWGELLDVVAFLPARR